MSTETKRDIAEIAVLIANGQAADLTKAEQDAFFNHCREQGLTQVKKARTSGGSKKAEPDALLTEIREKDEDLASDIESVIERLSEYMGENHPQSYAFIGVDHRAFGNVRVVEQWQTVKNEDGSPKLNDSGKPLNERTDDWSGSRGYPAVPLLK